MPKINKLGGKIIFCLWIHSMWLLIPAQNSLSSNSICIKIWQSHKCFTLIGCLHLSLWVIDYDCWSSWWCHVSRHLSEPSLHCGSVDAMEWGIGGEAGCRSALCAWLESCLFSYMATGRCLMTGRQRGTFNYKDNRCSKVASLPFFFLWVI